MRYFYSHARDPISSFSHYIGMCCALFGSLLLVWRAIRLQAAPAISIGAVVFGVSLVLLYAASTLYHFYCGSDKVLLTLRKLDHAIIYVLIAGTYTPIVLHGLSREKALLFLSAIWAVAIAGIGVKLFWINAPRPLYTALYLLMGWAILFEPTIFTTLEPGCITLVAAGGICYSAGAVIYIIKRPTFSKSFGFHEIFHLWVLAGSVLHYLAIYLYVLK